jgi:hypothetical protein
MLGRHSAASRADRRLPVERVLRPAVPPSRTTAVGSSASRPRRNCSTRWFQPHPRHTSTTYTWISRTDVASEVSSERDRACPGGLLQFLTVDVVDGGSGFSADTRDTAPRSPRRESGRPRADRAKRRRPRTCRPGRSRPLAAAPASGASSPRPDAAYACGRGYAVGLVTATCHHGMETLSALEISRVTRSTMTTTYLSNYGPSQPFGRP